MEHILKKKAEKVKSTMLAAAEADVRMSKVKGAC